MPPPRVPNWNTSSFWAFLLTAVLGLLPGAKPSFAFKEWCLELQGVYNGANPVPAWIGFKLPGQQQLDQYEVAINPGQTAQQTLAALKNAYDGQGRTVPPPRACARRLRPVVPRG